MSGDLTTSTANGTTAEAPTNKLYTFGRTIYGLLRLICIICHNVYHVFGFWLITWILLLPLYYLRPKVYYRIENHLYTYCLYTVGSWSWLAGIRVIECGDNIDDLLSKSSQHDNNNQQSHNLLPSPTIGGGDSAVTTTTSNGSTRSNSVAVSPTTQANGAPEIKKRRVMLLANHQSLGDVPLMFQAFVAKAKYCILWVMDHQFKFTHFGLVSATHGDYFIKAKQFVKSELTKHCTKHPDKDMVILFPEGGFRYKRAESSARFAEKQGWPVLNHLTWPRAGAFYDLADESLGVSHVVDLSILYDDQVNPISISDIIFGTRPGPIYFYYRVFEVKRDTVLDEQWLHARWLEKEQLLHEFYYSREQFLSSTAGQLRPIKMSWLKMMNIHLFYLAVNYWTYILVRLCWLYACDS